MTTKFSTLSLLAATLCAGAGLSHAADETMAARTAVVAELQVARASGELAAMVGEDSGSFWLARQAPRSTVSRQEVVAALLDAKANGPCATMDGEDPSAQCMAAAPYKGERTRAEVMAEARLARASGEIDALTGEDSGSVMLARRGAPVLFYAGPSLGVKGDAVATAASHQG